MISIKSLVNSAQNPTDKEETFVDFLLTSPSYQLAHKARTQGLTAAERKQRPRDFNKVLEVYDACGDIINRDFDDWWQERGRDLLRASQSKSDLIAYPVDLKIPTTKLVKEFTQFVNDLKEAKKQKPSPIEFVANKIKLGALHTKLELVNEKGRLELKSRKRIENWRLAVQSSLKSKWKTVLNPTSTKLPKNEQARVILGVLVSKHLKEALWIAENAARGIFPSMRPIDTGLHFDFQSIYRLSSRVIKVSHYQRQRKIKAGERVRKTYYERKVKPAIKRQQLIDELVEARLKIERLTQK